MKLSDLIGGKCGWGSGGERCCSESGSIFLYVELFVSRSLCCPSGVLSSV